MAARRAVLIGALLVAATTACLQDDGTRFNPIVDATTVSEDEERELGLEFDAELRKHVVVLEDPVVAGFISDLGQSMVDTIEPQPFIYRFRIIEDPSLNAFAVPGGYVYFHSGTVLAAGSVDELAGVMGHEIAHVKAHHYARMRQKTQIPDLLVGLAGMAAAVATKQPGVLLATQAANVAVKLRFSREFENEADRLGGVFMTRAGFDPLGITRFFERILAEEKKHPGEVPPYLYSHPDVEDRIASVQQEAKSLRPTHSADPRFREALSEVQARIAWLQDTGRESVPPPTPPEDPEHIAGLLSEADALAGSGRTDEALLTLSRAEALEPHDPRPSFRIGEILAEQGRHREATEAYRRTVRLDPSRALVFYKLGVSYEALGERHLAVYAFEQASRRAGDASVLRRRADWQIETEIFPVLLDAGLADGTRGEGDTPLGHSRTSFAAGTRRLAWWGRLSSRYAGYAKRIHVRWIDPHGQVVAETRARPVGGSHIGSVLELPDPGATAEGHWRAEAVYEEDVLDRRSFGVAAPHG